MAFWASVMCHRHCAKPWTCSSDPSCSGICHLAHESCQSSIFKSAPLGHVLQMCCHFHLETQIITLRTKETLEDGQSWGPQPWLYMAHHMHASEAAALLAGKLMGFVLGFVFVFYSKSPWRLSDKRTALQTAPGSAGGQCRHRDKKIGLIPKKDGCSLSDTCTHKYWPVSISMGRTAIKLMAQSQSQWLLGPFTQTGGARE